MDQDWQDKRVYKEGTSVDKNKPNSDIDENNILSYLYTQKDHQAYVYDKKKQHLIDLIVKNNSQLGSSEALQEKEMSIYLKDLKRINKKNEEV
jgi:hypothetical protein